MSLFRYTRAGQTPGTPRTHSPLPWIALIALILGAIALAFAWLAGWIGDRLTAQRFTDTIEATGPAHPGLPTRAQQGHLRERLVRTQRAGPYPVQRPRVLTVTRTGDGPPVDWRR